MTFKFRYFEFLEKNRFEPRLATFQIHECPHNRDNFFSKEENNITFFSRKGIPFHSCEHSQVWKFTSLLEPLNEYFSHFYLHSFHLRIRRKEDMEICKLSLELIVIHSISLILLQYNSMLLIESEQVDISPVRIWNKNSAWRTISESKIRPVSITSIESACSSEN